MDVRDLVHALLEFDAIGARQWVADALRERIQWHDVPAPSIWIRRSWRSRQVSSSSWPNAVDKLRRHGPGKGSLSSTAFFSCGQRNRCLASGSFASSKAPSRCASGASTPHPTS
jgi:hypothetical protein